MEPPIRLDSPIWSRLPTAYGTAEGIPELFERCVVSRDGALWGDLYNNVCHQGTPYGCAWALIPHLVERLNSLDVYGFYSALGILAANVRYAPDSAPFPELDAPYQTALATLRGRLTSLIRSRAEELKSRTEPTSAPSSWRTCAPVLEGRPQRRYWPALRPSRRSMSSVRSAMSCSAYR